MRTSSAGTIRSALRKVNEQSNRRKSKMTKSRKINLKSYFASKPLPCGFYINPSALPNGAVTLKYLKTHAININCFPETRFNCKTETYRRKIRKIEKDFGLRNVGGGMFIGGNEYDNEFMFTEKQLENIASLPEDKI